jgi:hypothetical protein
MPQRRARPRKSRDLTFEEGLDSTLAWLRARLKVRAGARLLALERKHPGVSLGGLEQKHLATHNAARPAGTGIRCRSAAMAARCVAIRQLARKRQLRRYQARAATVGWRSEAEVPKCSAVTATFYHRGLTPFRHRPLVGGESSTRAGRLAHSSAKHSLSGQRQHK